MALAQPDPRRHRLWGQFALSILIAILIIWSWFGSNIDVGRVFSSGERVAEFLGRMARPDLSILPIMVEASAETLQIAILGTVGSVVLSVIFGILAAKTLMPAFIHVPVKSFLAAIRAIPLLLVAMLMVVAVGLGPLPGILAIAFHATGMLAKFYAEAIENVDPAPIEALESAGASFWQKLRFGAWRQMAPDFVRDTLFRFEMNLRDSLVLGIVGAGGIGFYIQTYIRAFQYEKVATLTIVLVLFVILIELANSVARSLVR